MSAEFDNAAPEYLPQTRIERVESLLSQMSLEEKVGQMTQLSMFKEQDDDAQFDRLLDLVRQGKIGSFLNAPGREARNELQRAAVETSRLGIPLIFGRDVIHGYRTIFPIPLALASSFDPGLARATAAAAAREASESGIDWTFAPMVDVTREPRWGRVAEGYGEDPLLAARFGAAVVRGFQGPRPGAEGSVAACAKHYVAYGAAEAGKEYNTTWVPERLLRDLYLPPFQACVDAGVMTVMCGFNDLNGVPMSGNRWALRDVLKGELGFGGFVISDWASTHEMIAHGNCSDDRDVAVASASAGVDMEMVSSAYSKHLVEAVEAGHVSLEEVDDAVRRILVVKHQLGLFERPYTAAPVESTVLSKGHLDLAREAARASLVLLKNEGDALPLPRGLGTIALVGSLANDRHNPLGTWSFDGDRDASVTLLTALQQRCGDSVRIEHFPGVPDPRSSDTSGFEAALAGVRRADAAIVVLGEDGNISGECRSRAYLDLPGAQSALLERLASAGKPLVLVVMAGRPLALDRELVHASAVLYAWHVGTMHGPAIADVLFGDVPPSGKLPISFPRTVGQVPIYYNYKNTGRPPKGTERGVPRGTPLDPVDMVASYLDVEVTPQFPFGFGLSYTRFEYTDVQVSTARVSFSEPVTVSATVKNIGARAGTEVAQLYVRDRVGSVTRPVRELKGFVKLSLAPGESQRVSFELGAADLAFCGPDHVVVAEAGMFDVYIGGDSRAELRAEFELVVDSSR
ncbi:MAG TPA: glycoside hydrolase family 3 N-terminal domain-containing protein [Polyangiaceae bacterium]|nr:glycoside hydrolase family 3 N-terminal domain-containing protein [Polyangiaceae bacterium]